MQGTWVKGHAGGTPASYQVEAFILDPNGNCDADLGQGVTMTLWLS